MPGAGPACTGPHPALNKEVKESSAVVASMGQALGEDRGRLCDWWAGPGRESPGGQGASCSLGSTLPGSAAPLPALCPKPEKVGRFSAGLSSSHVCKKALAYEAHAAPAAGGIWQARQPGPQAGMLGVQERPGS